MIFTGQVVSISFEDLQVQVKSFWYSKFEIENYKDEDNKGKDDKRLNSCN